MGQSIETAKRDLQTSLPPQAPANPQTGLPNYYASIGGPLYGQPESAVPLRQAEVAGEARKEVVQESVVGKDLPELQQQQQQQQQQPLTPLERQAGITLADDNNKKAGAGGLKSLQKVGSTMLIVAGLIGLALAALLIWPAAIAIKQSKSLQRYDSGSEVAAAKPSTGVAKTMAIVTAILGGLGLLAGIAGLVGGQSPSIFGGLFAISMLTVGAIAFHRLTKSSDSASDKTRGAWSHAASGLWIAGIVLGLILPALGAIIAGSVIASL